MILLLNFIPGAVFSYSWDLRFGNTGVGVPFGNLKFTNQVSGYGNSGVATGQFEFDLYDETGIFSNALLENVPVHLEEKNNKCLPSREYYISKRTVNNKICHFTAYDIMIKSDQELNISPLNVFFSRGEKAPCGNVLEAIKNQCGFAYVSSSASGTELISFTKDQLENATVRSVLEAIAEAMQGVWIATRDGGAVLSCLGEPYHIAPVAACEHYSEINYQGQQKITKLVCENTDTNDRREHSTGEYGAVIAVSSPYVACSNGTDGSVWQRIQGYTYQAWSIQKALVSSGDVDIPVPAKITFGETALMSTNITVTVDASGIYLSAGAEPQEEWNYDDYEQRQINQRVAYDTTAGNIQISKGSGIQFINKNKTSAISTFSVGDNDIEKYGFDVQSQGVTTYSGAMLDSVFPALEVNDDATELTADYGGTVKKYRLTWDGDTKLSMEEIKEDTV